MKKIAIVNLAAVFVLAGFFCWGNVPTAKALIQTNTSADIVVGQSDMTSSNANQGNAAAANNTLYEPRGVFSDGNKMIVTDYSNNRVLIYNSIPTGNNAGADVVIGQQNMTSRSANQGGSVGANTFIEPINVFYDGTRLFVADWENNRVLIYNSLPTSNGASADVVIGQADMTHNSENQGGSADANTLNGPVAVYSDGTRLYVADMHNSRVLIYNSIPTANNASADVVIGQQNMASNSANQGGSVGAGTLLEPTGVFIENGKLFIADYSNSRVLIYNSVPTASNAEANVVVGQADFTHNDSNQGSSSASASTLSRPVITYVDGTRLYVSDMGNARMLVYNSIPVSNGASADIVIGQENMTQNEINRDGAVGANTLYQTHQIWVDAFRLFATDAYNNRLLIYNLGPEFTLNKNKSATFAGGEKVRVSKKKIRLWGKKKTFKKGRVRVFQNGTLKKVVKIKKSGSWKAKFKDSESAMRSYKFKYYNTAGANTESSRTYVFQISRTNAAATSIGQPAGVSVPEKSSGGSTKKEKRIWGVDFPGL